MMAMTKLSVKGLLAGAFLACMFTQGASATTEVSGVKFEDSVKVGGKDLKLNGAGMRTKFIVKVYAAGLYLPEKKNNVPEVLKVEGPRRMTLVMMREISSDDFGQAFMTGLNNNIDKTEKSKFVTQISKFGEMFGQIDALKKGDVLHIDWIPGTGTQCELNGKKIGEVLPDVNYYNAVLRIWLGDKPVDSALKPLLLGEAK
jgi:hypothetical protein